MPALPPTTPTTSPDTAMEPVVDNATIITSAIAALENLINKLTPIGEANAVLAIGKLRGALDRLQTK